MIKIDCVSDLHGHYPKLEGGDLLIVAGDLTATDTRGEYNRFSHWLHDQEYKKKIFVSGNHDNFLQKEMLGMVDTVGMFECDKEKIYLCDSGTEFEYEEKFLENAPAGTQLCHEGANFCWVLKKKLKIWGSPWTKCFPGMNPNCMAFTVDTDEELAEKWALIPDDVDILITHCPSFGNFDVVKDYSTGTMPSVGSLSLWMKCLEIRPKIHVFGHIHEGYGYHQHANGMKIINASYVNECYEPVNKPIRVEL